MATIANLRLNVLRSRARPWCSLCFFDSMEVSPELCSSPSARRHDPAIPTAEPRSSIRAVGFFGGGPGAAGGDRTPPRPDVALLAVDRDPFHLLLRFRRFRQRYGENPVLERCP